MDHENFLSTAAKQFEESAIRRTRALAGRVPDLISFAPGYPAPEVFPWEELRAIAADLVADLEIWRRSRDLEILEI